jgi:hypothetical protein
VASHVIAVSIHLSCDDDEAQKFSVGKESVHRPSEKASQALLCKIELHEPNRQQTPSTQGELQHEVAQ